jgi:circadian clock protein KaiC
MPNTETTKLVHSPTGIDGLDEILSGGLPANRFYLIQGDPGVGKTTLALQFLMEGRKKGEKGLYITLSETKDELLAVARSHNWSLDGLDIIELAAMEAHILAATQNTLFHPAEVELNQTVDMLLKEVERVCPARVVFDSLSEIRLLAQDSLRYRRQMLSFKQYFAKRCCTVLLLDDRTAGESDLHIQSIAHGVLSLQRLHNQVGSVRRQISVVKLRGAVFQDGYHDYTIRTGGLEVFPRMMASEKVEPFETGLVSSRISELDDLLGGGMDRGTSNLIMGPAGAGKSTVSCQYATAAADRGEKVAIYMFDENIYTLTKRAEALGMNLSEHIDSGMIMIHHVDAAELSPGEMAASLRRAVEEDGVRMVIIDSLNGYLNAMPEERFLSLQLHELLSYLSQRGVVSILIMAQHGLLGDMQAPADLTYLADTVLLIRYFELSGSIKKALSVIKKRSGRHEGTIREFGIMNNRLTIGAPLEGFQGVLRGVPTYSGEFHSLMGAVGEKA